MIWCLENTGLGKNVDPRLRELAPVARGSQEAGSTQPRVRSIADPCTQEMVKKSAGIDRSKCNVQTRS